MGRPKNLVDTVEIKIATTPQVEALLKQLVDSGLFGKTVPEAAAICVNERLRELMKDPALHLTPQARGRSK